MKLIKISLNTWENASRDKRELSVLNELGVECCVFAKSECGDKGCKTEISGFPVFRYSTRPLGNQAFLIQLNRFISIFLWAIYIRRYHADMLSCHDISALLIGWLSTLFIGKKNRPKLIYDSHEFEIGRSGDRNKAAKWFVTRLERFLMKRCAFSIMVNDSIADEVQRIHKLRQRPVVVRSMPNCWDIDQSVIKQKRHELLSGLGVPDDTFTIMYHGGIMSDRGIESVIELVAMNPNIAGIVLGNGEAEYLDALKALAARKGVAGRVLFHEAVPIEDLWKYAGAADAGMVTVLNSCLSYYYMLPNKFFENIQSLTPIIGSDFPEIRRITNEYGIGLLCDPSDMEAMNACVEKMRTDKVFYESCKAGLAKAKSELCWENEKQRLVDAYEKYIPNDLSKNE